MSQGVRRVNIRTTTGGVGRAIAAADRAGAAAERQRKRNRAGRPTADELERRKQRVMDVATDMFVHRGYAATTLLDIAKRAGVATRTLYQHFGDKEAIFREVIFARNTPIVETPQIEADDDLRTVLRKAAGYSFEVALRPRSIELMRLMIAESARFPELMSLVANTAFARFKGNLADLFQSLAERGLIADGDHARAADVFADLLLGNRTVMIYFGWQSSPPGDDDIEVKLDLFIAGQAAMAKAGGKPEKTPKAAKPAAKSKGKAAKAKQG